MDQFSLMSSGIVGFNSIRSETGEIQQTSRGIQTGEIATEEKATNSVQTSESSTQSDAVPTMKILTENEELKLAAWLKKILPSVEEELEQGVLALPEDSSGMKLTIKKQAVIDFGTLRKDEEAYETGCEKASAAWLSLSTMNAPVLATTISASSHPQWCQHAAKVIIFRPKLQENTLIWSEIKSIPVKACIESLAVNNFNRDMFAGGTITGDLYIWKYLYNEPEPIEALYADSTQYGGIVGIDFQQLPHHDDYSCLTCHNDGYILQWKIGKIVVKDKTMRAVNISRSESLALTTMVAINSTEFIVGTVDGLLLRCSTLHTKPLDTHLDPVNETFGKQQFSITKLQEFNGEYLISCDASLEIHVFDLRKMTVVTVVKMPLLNQTIACLNLDFILGAGPNGEVLALKTHGNEQELIENNLRGQASCIEISRNRKWAITGAYEGKFQIFQIEIEQ